MQMLSQEQLDTYHQQGYLACKQVVDPPTLEKITIQVANLMHHPLVRPDNSRCRYHAHHQTGESLLEAVDPVIDLASEVQDLALSNLIRGHIGQLLNEPAFLLKDKVIYKQPGSNGYSLHQDYIAWPEFPMTCTIALVAIDPSDAISGCLEMFPGCHKDGYLSPKDGEYHRLSDSLFADVTAELVPLKPGDVMYFHCMTPHRSAPNRAEHMRRHLYLSYNGLSDGGDIRDDFYKLQAKWFMDRTKKATVFE